MRVAVTGSSGQLGRFVMAAVRQQHEAVPIDVVPLDGHDTRLADVLDPGALERAMAGCEAVIHLAAIDAARQATEQAFFETNVMGTWNVLSTAERLGMRLAVLCSSVSALGLRAGLPPDSLPIRVDHPLRPVSAYGLSKQAGETLAAAFGRRGKLPVVVLRPSLVIFPHHAAAWAHAAAEMDGLAAPGPAVAAAPEAVPLTCSYIGVQDCARAFAAALRLEGSAGPFYLTADDTMSSRPTREMLADRFGTPSAVTNPALYEADPRASPFDLQPTLAALGWRPQDRWTDIGRLLHASP